MANILALNISRSAEDFRVPVFSEGKVEDLTPALVRRAATRQSALQNSTSPEKQAKLEALNKNESILRLAAMIVAGIGITLGYSASVIPFPLNFIPLGLIGIFAAAGIAICSFAGKYHLLGNAIKQDLKNDMKELIQLNLCLKPSHLFSDFCRTHFPESNFTDEGYRVALNAFESHLRRESLIAQYQALKLENNPVSPA